MVKVSKFVKDPIPLCVCALGIAVLGYLGYHAVRWIINKCHKTKKINQIAQKIISSLSPPRVLSSNNHPTNPPILPFSQLTGSRQSDEAWLNEDFLRQQDESCKKTLAAATIQRVYRGHIAYVALQKLKTEKSEKQKSTATVDMAQRDKSQNHLKKIQVKQILERPVETFAKDTVNLYFPDGHRQPVNIHHYADVETLLETVTKNVDSSHLAMEIYFDWPTSDREVALRMESFQKFSAGKLLQFSISKYRNRTIVIQPKPIKSENGDDGKVWRFYANGISEVFLLIDHGYAGIRIFPDGKQEKGEFHRESGKLISGYRIEIDKRIEFINPKSFASYKEASEKSEFEIHDVEGRLVVLEKTYGEDYWSNYAITDIPVEIILLKSSQRPSYGNGKSIEDVLLHKSFDENKRSFIEHLLATNELSIPRLFELSNFAALDVIKIGSKITGLNPLKIINPLSGRNFIIQAAYWESAELLNKLIELFPEEFLSIGQNVIAELLIQGHSRYLVCDVAEQFKKLGGGLDTYHRLWIQVAQATKPDETFAEQFHSLSTDQQQTLYDSAFIYNNPFIYESSNPSITADQYSINLMWINKSKVPDDQKFLFGNGLSFKKRELDFHNRFIKPASKWARTNPRSPINIWVDSEMATSQVIERSKVALETALEGTSHGIIQFRDVRSMDVVRSNPRAFSEKIPVRFRVDLLRAIAADYTLRQKETKFFVYGDLDMKPLSEKEIFDKRTVNFLNDFGFVMAKGGHLGFENGFQILNGENFQFMDSHRKVIIDLSVEMTLARPDAIKEHQIYDTYPAMVTHFLDVDGRYGKLNLLRKEDKLEDPSVMLRYFRYDRFGISAHYNLPLGEGKIKLKEIMPRRPVRLSFSHF